MRIIYLHQYFNTLKMSGGTRSYEMARRLVKKGHEVNIITSWRGDSKNKTWFETEEDGIKVHWLPVPYSNHMSNKSRIQAFLKFAIQAGRKAQSIKCDVIFATSTPLTIALPAIYASQRQRAPMVFEVRDLWPEVPIAIGALRNPILRKCACMLEKFAYARSEAIVALSPGMRDGIIRSGISEDRIAVIPNGSDNKFFEEKNFQSRQFRDERPWLQNRPLLVYAGTFGMVNGVSYLVEIAEKLKIKSPNVRILLIGDGQERAKVEKYAAQLDVLNKNLFIESQIAKEKIPALFDAADMACNLVIDLPELRANSANKFFDALASGTPVLLNHGGWMADIIQATGAGIITWNRSIEEAAQLISDSIQNETWLTTAGKSAKRLAENFFDRDILATQLESVLELAVIRKGSSVYQISSGDYRFESN